MNMSKFIDINESELNLNVLKAPGKDGLRGDTLLSKVKEFRNKLKGYTQSVSPLTLKDGTLLSIDNPDEILIGSKKYDKKKAESLFKKNGKYIKVFKGEDGNYYKLNDIKKTSEFGGGGGSSLGTNGTEEVEAIQCLVISMQQKFLEMRKGKIDIEQLNDLVNSTDDEFELYKRDISVNINITKDMISKYIDSWGYTFQKTANALYGKTKIKIVDSKSKESDYILRNDKHYKFYQINSPEGVCQAIKSKFKQCKNSSFKHIAKWNPADTWAVSSIKESIITNEINKCAPTIKNLNILIDKYFDSRDLVGISLKKVKSDDNGNITMIINKVTEPPLYKLKKIKMSEDPFQSLGVKIVATKSSGLGSGIEYMTIRTSSSTSFVNVRGEIDGKVSRHGNISLTMMNNILSNYKDDDGNPVKVPTVRDIDSKIKGLHKTDDELRTSIKSMFQFVRSKGSKRCDISPVSKREFVSDRRRLISKYQSLYLSKILLEFEDMIGRPSDAIVQDIFYYAMSIMSIGMDGTNERTPKFVRVIDNN